MSTIGYIRVSTSQQAERGVSLSAQRERIKAAAVAQGTKSVDIIADKGISGRTIGRRPGVQQVLRAVESGSVDKVIVWKLDRLTRSVRDLLDIHETLTKHGARLVSLTEHLDTGTAVGRMVMTIIAAVAQMESEQTGDRIRMAAQHCRAMGHAWGTVPWGYRRRGKKFVRHEPDWAAVRCVVRLRAQGLRWDQVADRLLRSRHRTRSRKRWTYKLAYYVGTIVAARLRIRLPVHRPVQHRRDGYRYNSDAHRAARAKVPSWRRKQIARLGAMARERIQAAKRSGR